jgi:death-on-curing protein
MISESDAEFIHEILIEKFGGSKGLRDKSLLESALSRPYQTFDKHELYPSIIEKAAALFESLIINHPFIDGNKRIAYFLMALLLKQHNINIRASQAEKYDFVILASKGEFRFEQIKEWLINHV